MCLQVPYVRNNVFRRFNGLRLLPHSIFTIHAAKDCNKSVIIHRNGMTLNNHMLFYNGQDVIPGQWLRGKRVLLADLSHNGELKKQLIVFFRFCVLNQPRKVFFVRFAIQCFCKIHDCFESTAIFQRIMLF